MARGTIVARELGNVVWQDDGSCAVVVRGKQPKVFANEKDAQSYLAKHGEKRYDTVIRINGKQQWKTFLRKKDAEAYLDQNSTETTPTGRSFLRRSRNTPTAGGKSISFRKN